MIKPHPLLCNAVTNISFLTGIDTSFFFFLIRKARVRHYFYYLLIPGDFADVQLWGSHDKTLINQAINFFPTLQKISISYSKVSDLK